MKKKSNLLFILFILLFTTIFAISCEKKTEGNLIEPLYTKVDLKNISDGIYRVKFTPDDIKEEKDGMYIEPFIYSEDLFDTVELHNIKVGDRIFYRGNEEKVETLFWDKDGSRCCINFPSFEEAEEEFRPSESGGTYYIVGPDDHHSYTLRGKARIKMDDKLVMKDSSMWGEPEKEIPMKEIKNHMLSDNPDYYFHLNTYLRVENGKVVEMIHHYIP